MPLTNKTRMGKRKLEMQELRKEKQITTSKKHDKNCLDDKNSQEASKSQLAILQEQFDKLKVEYEKQVERNHALEEKIEVLEKQSNHPNVVTTNTGDILMLCHECEYPAEDIYDLGEHMYEVHSEREDENKCISCNFCDSTFPSIESCKEHETKKHKEEWACNFCSESFESKRDLMLHKKKQHVDKVSSCWKHSLGICEYGDENCWFSHTFTNNSLQFKCKVCDHSFLTKSEYLRHMRQSHPSTVQICRNITENGGCKYGVNCWFIHEEIGNSFYENTNNEKIQELFQRLEKMTQQISNLEQK